MRVVLWRSAVSFARLPLGRLGRLVGLAAITGLVANAAAQGSTALVAVVAVAAFVIGLDLTEALAQTLDQPDLRHLLPREPGPLLTALLVAPALAALPLVGVAVGCAAAVSGTSALIVGAVIGLPVLWAGMSGAVVNVVRGAPDPLARVARVVTMPPEVAGVSTVVQTAWPLVVSMIGVTPLVFVSDAVEHGGSLAAAALRGAVASLLVTGAVVVWVRTRDDLRRRWRILVTAGDEARREAAQRRRAQRGATS